MNRKEDKAEEFRYF